MANTSKTSDFLNLSNSEPIPTLAIEKPESQNLKKVFENLQGNILKGHGRDFSANIFLKFLNEKDPLHKDLTKLTQDYVTSAYKQLKETEQYNRFKIPGSMFGNLFLTVRAYKKLNFTDSQLAEIFEDSNKPAELDIDILPQHSNFLNGMLKSADELGDIPAFLKDIDVDDATSKRFSPIQQSKLAKLGKIKKSADLEPLEKAYLSESIDGMLLLADDDQQYLMRKVRDLVSELESTGIAEVLSVELGESLRNDDGEGIEHFGYVDGRSQPLFLDSDFVIKNGVREEKVDDKASRREDGEINIWDPFSSLKNVLIKDQACSLPYAYGSYFVFRKLEQDVLHFSMREQELADALCLTGKDRERAGAMAVGRYRDGTPLTLSTYDGAIPAKTNNFRYDGLDSNLKSGNNHHEDRLGLKCPFQAHIRKANPRHSTEGFGDSITQNEESDRSRAITRRGIPYGKRVRHPNAFQALDDLPTGDVGLLFACFQNSILHKFSFMQKTWLNNPSFKKNSIENKQGTTAGNTGIDPLVGQSNDLQDGNPKHNWRSEYGDNLIRPVAKPALGDLNSLDLKTSHSVNLNFSDLIKFRGGEFFFTPSLAFLKNEQAIE